MNLTLTEKERHGAILGKDLMTKIWSNMRSTRLPSWLTPAPANWGTSKRGKLSASNWNVICTIHMPITLIWAWRNETGRKKFLLENFMHLVSAVRIAKMRVSSPSQITAYDSHIQQYLQGIQELFPQQKLRPAQHAALHISEGLQKFGPDHSHSASFYERYISLFHKMNNNNTIGVSYNLR